MLHVISDLIITQSHITNTIISQQLLFVLLNNHYLHRHIKVFYLKIILYWKMGIIYIFVF